MRKIEKYYVRELHKLIDEIFERACDTYEWDWYTLASKAGLSYQTVYNQGQRKVKLPEHRTVYLLARAVGMEVQLKQIQQKFKVKAA